VPISRSGLNSTPRFVILSVPAISLLILSTNTLSGPVTSVPLFHPHPGLTLRHPRD